jgi:hypothetical protein
MWRIVCEAVTHQSERIIHFTVRIICETSVAAPEVPTISPYPEPDEPSVQLHTLFP